MSVINKMLRDLDSRQPIGSLTEKRRLQQEGITSGTMIAKDSGRAMHKLSLSNKAMLVIGLVMLGCCVAVALGYLYLNHANAPMEKKDAPSVVSAAVNNTPVRMALVEPVVAVSPVPALDKHQEPRKSELVDSPLKMDTNLMVMPRLAMTPKNDGVSKLAAEPAPPTVGRLAAPVSPTTSGVLAVPQSSPRRSPAIDALAQAQILWNAGSRDAAMDLVRDSMAAVERTNLADSASGNNFVLAALARELARMELAEGRTSQVLAMLVRLEPSLSGYADIWAMRGNLSQRLGRHEESSTAYLAALKLKPGEPRWMLGAAVSLAAQGKTESAAELAEKARSGGVLTPEIASYLRQLGVVLHER